MRFMCLLALLLGVVKFDSSIATDLAARVFSYSCVSFICYISYYNWDFPLYLDFGWFVSFPILQFSNGQMLVYSFSSRLSYCSRVRLQVHKIKFSSILQKRIPAEAGINVICVSPGIVHTNVARDLPKVLVAAYHLIPYFIFDAQEGSRSTLFAATDPQVPDYYGMLKADEWPVCTYISHDCRPTNASKEAHNLETSQAVWDNSLKMIGLPSDALEKLIDGKNVDFTLYVEKS